MTYVENDQHSQNPVRALDDDINRQFPAWHFSMMNDHSRNGAIYEAIDSIDLAGLTVFEIGTGAGLIAMYFAKAGAKHVYTCEQDQQLYELAVETIAQNGLSEKITVINDTSTNFINSSRFNFIPDLIFTETLDCGVVGEGYRCVADDIRSIARPNTIILPSEIRQYAFMVNSSELISQNSIEKNGLFDLSLINKYSTRSYFPVRYKMYQSQTLSESRMIRNYTYLDNHRNADVFSLTAYSSGICHGVVSYFHAQFGKSIVSNDVRDSCHWHQAFHPFLDPIAVKSGDRYQFTLNNDGSVSTFQS